ncbi:hypothetical protein E2C01_005192 [Portunus trituberculatus]|uniref:Uncharacterized protein n=1 Tax=Portunus trituberculatus TaxID=210409 RepID=A0A5B7CYG7_PORTR|nr:hypothetical protein [Portunus trituberculatus]
MWDRNQRTNVECSIREYLTRKWSDFRNNVQINCRMLPVGFISLCPSSPHVTNTIITTITISITS